MVDKKKIIIILALGVLAFVLGIAIGVLIFSSMGQEAYISYENNGIADYDNGNPEPIPTPSPTLLPTPSPEPTPEPTQEPSPIPEYPDYPEEDEEEHDLYPPTPIVLTDPRVRWVVEPTWDFDAVFEFSEGMAAVEFYDRTGEVTPGGEYEHILGYVNRQGEIVIPIVHRHWPPFYGHRGAPPFSHGLVAVQSNDYGGVGVFDIYGNLVVPFYFLDAWVFSEGLMAVRAPFSYDDEGNRVSPGWGYIDTTGELVIAFQFHYASFFRDGRAAVLMDGLWGFIDHSGEVIIPYQFQFLSGQADFFYIPQFSDGLARVNIGDAWDWYSPDITWSYIDLYGEMVIPDTYRPPVSEPYNRGNIHRQAFPSSRDFSEGFAAVAHGEGTDWDPIDNRRWGFIDEDGRIVIPIEFHQVGNVSEGLVWVRQGRWWGIIEVVL